jgi:hypothetical protein
MRGGARPGAGRPKGTGKLQRQRQAQVATAESMGLTPLEFMLRIMNDPAEDPTRRDRMAQAAAPYVHAKLAPRAAAPAEPTAPEKAAAIAFIIRSAAGHG